MGLLGQQEENSFFGSSAKLSEAVLQIAQSVLIFRSYILTKRDGEVGSSLTVLVLLSAVSGVEMNHNTLFLGVFL